MSQIKLKCDRCGGFFRDNNINIKCGYCKKKEKQELIEEFLSKKTLIPLIAKIIEKETNEEYCSSEIIAELIYDKLKEKWEERSK